MILGFEPSIELLRVKFMRTDPKSLEIRRLDPGRLLLLRGVPPPPDREVPDCPPSNPPARILASRNAAMIPSEHLGDLHS